MRDWQVNHKRTYAPPVSIRAMPENVIPPALRVDYFLCTGDLKTCYDLLIRKYRFFGFKTGLPAGAFSGDRFRGKFAGRKRRRGKRKRFFELRRNHGYKIPLRDSGKRAETGRKAAALFDMKANDGARILADGYAVADVFAANRDYF